MEVTGSVRVARAADDVFQYIADFENNPAWQKGMVAARWTSAPPHGVGSVYEQEARFLGKAILTTFEVTDFKPGHRVRISSIGGSFPIQVTRTVTPDGEGCQVRADVSGQPGGFFRVAGPLMRWMVKRSVQGDYKRLKAILEA